MPVNRRKYCLEYLDRISPMAHEVEESTKIRFLYFLCCNQNDEDVHIIYTTIIN